MLFMSKGFPCLGQGHHPLNLNYFSKKKRKELVIIEID